MKKKTLYTSIVLLMLSLTAFGQKASLNYTLDINDREDDQFKVVLNIKKLTAENDIYQFAATAPGTYQTMNLGRLVRSFKAFDKKGNEISTEKVGENQWKLSNPQKIKKIEYSIAETWDTPVEDLPIYKMAGSSLEADHMLFNAHCVIGYPKGMQNSPLTLNFKYPSDWQVGTALNKNEKGLYYAKNYDLAVDSPILMGRLTEASADFNGTKIEIYTYSVTDKIKSNDLLESMTAMLMAANEFVVDFPVDRYTFLFHFEDESAGAWEHSYSSEYIYNEADYAENGGKKITSTAAHEFFHVITPLNIHSEIISQFNFVTPTASEHLWLYEGTTEWASDMMQLRGGLMNLDEFFATQKEKLRIDEYLDQTYSLSDLSLNSFTPEGQKQYYNIYCRGALVAGLLDIRLLELSEGKRGLREVINELSKKYGPDQAFPEADFFDLFTEMTYPEIAEFFNLYVKKATALPLKDYYENIGIAYQPLIETGDSTAMVGSGFNVVEGKLVFKNVSEELAKMGVQENDVITSVEGTPLSLGNANALLSQLMQKNIGDTYSISVFRGEEEIKIDAKMLSTPKIEKFVFSINPTATEKQVLLRDAWIKNM
jgi:predicted metalloprotease with PDZ domain